MTKQQFLEALKETSANLNVVQKGKLLRFYHSNYSLNANCFCPITAVCFVKTNKSYQMTEWREAANYLGLDPELATAIAYTADFHRPNMELRMEMERAIGILVMPIYWTDSLITKKLPIITIGTIMFNLTTEQMNRLITAASQHKELIESSGKEWSSVDIVKDGSFFTISVSRGRIHSDNTKELPIVTYRYYLDAQDRIQYSEIIHL